MKLIVFVLTIIGFSFGLVPTCTKTVIGGIPVSANCTGCFSFGPGFLNNIKTDIDLTNIVIDLGKIVPKGLVSVNIRTPNIEIAGIDFGSFGTTLDLSDLVKQIPTVNTNIQAAIVENALRKIINLPSMLGQICWNAFVDQCSEDIGFSLQWNNQETLADLRIHLRDYLSCGTDAATTDSISGNYFFGEKKIQVCVPFMQQYLSNTLCFSLGTVRWDRSAVSFCPAVEFQLPHLDSSQTSFSWDCISVGAPNNCLPQSTCTECMTVDGCGWCSSSRSCVNASALPGQCAGCPETVSSTCDDTLGISEQDAAKAANDFDLYDLDHDWSLSLDEFKEQLGVFMASSDQQEASFAALDSNSDGSVSYVEYRDFRIAQDYPTLSAGAIVGIVLAILVFLVLVGALIVFLLYKKRPETYKKLKFWQKK